MPDAVAELDTGLTRQPIIDSIHQLEYMVAELWVGQQRSVAPGTDVDARALADRILTEMSASGVFTADELSRARTVIPDLLGGGHEHCLWARIQRADLFDQWYGRPRDTYLPENWLLPNFADAELLQRVPIYGYSEWSSSVTRDQFERMFTDLAEHVATGPEPGADEQWLREGEAQAYDLAVVLARYRPAGLSAGDAHRATRVLAALYKNERLLDTSGRLVQPVTLIGSDAACEDWYSARNARIVPSATPTTPMNRWELAASVGMLEQKLANQPGQDAPLPVRVAFWDSVDRHVEHLLYTVVGTDVLDADEKARAVPVLNAVRVDHNRPPAAWSTVTDPGVFASWQQSPEANMMIGGLSRDGVINALADLSFHATAHRALHPLQPLPPALRIAAYQLHAAAERRTHSLRGSADSVQEAARIAAVLQALLDGGETRYLWERARDAKVFDAWYDSTQHRRGSDWVLQFARPGQFLDLPGVAPIPDSRRPALSRPLLRTAVGTLLHHVRQIPAPSADGSRTSEYSVWAYRLDQLAREIVSTLRSESGDFSAGEAARGDRLVAAIAAGRGIDLIDDDPWRYIEDASAFENWLLDCSIATAETAHWYSATRVAMQLAAGDPARRFTDAVGLAPYPPREAFSVGDKYVFKSETTYQVLTEREHMGACLEKMAWIAADLPNSAEFDQLAGTVLRTAQDSDLLTAREQRRLVRVVAGLSNGENPGGAAGPWAAVVSAAVCQQWLRDRLVTVGPAVLSDGRFVAAPDLAPHPSTRVARTLTRPEIRDLVRAMAQIVADQQHSATRSVSADSHLRTLANEVLDPVRATSVLTDEEASILEIGVAAMLAGEVPEVIVGDDTECDAWDIIVNPDTGDVWLTTREPSPAALDPGLFAAAQTQSVQVAPNPAATPQSPLTPTDDPGADSTTVIDVSM
ncbi:hypothetical protein ACQP2U_43055 (plasmid) [Nocardia sp. CA-084685]|uniref:hypothetical protein n=1 Tax=Nocardia sp. CA-084685 TaxID=3239970 RepID=UPI003D981ADE